jgi:hypothetical protein
MFKRAKEADPILVAAQKEVRRLLALSPSNTQHAHTALACDSRHPHAPLRIRPCLPPCMATRVLPPDAQC